MQSPGGNFDNRWGRKTFLIYHQTNIEWEVGEMEWLLRSSVAVASIRSLFVSKLQGF